jgi:hypothetical protein
MSGVVDLNGATGFGITYATSASGVHLFPDATIAATATGTNPIKEVTVQLANHTPSMSLGLDFAWGGSVSYDSSTGVMTLTASGDKTDITWQNVLRSVVFSDFSGTSIDPGLVTVTATRDDDSTWTDYQALRLNRPPVNFPSETIHTNADEFSSKNSYSLNTGTDEWHGAWREQYDGNSSSSTGYIRINNSSSQTNSLQLQFRGGGSTQSPVRTITREAAPNLANANSASLSFSYESTTTSSEALVTVQISVDNAIFFDLGTIGANGADGTFEADISAFISASTYIRFVVPQSLGNNNPYIAVDNIILSYKVTDSTTLPTQLINLTSSPHIVFSSANGNAIRVSDVNDANLTVKVSVLNGTLKLADTTGLRNVVGDATSTLMFSGSIADINNALDGLDYHTTSTDTSRGGIDDTLTIKTTDVHGGADTDTVHIDCFCFYPGTMVRTPDGEAAVETLKLGDLVKSSDGRALPVRWLGRQTISMTFADLLRVLPIRIKAGALTNNVPSRDLLVSPDHALLVNGALIQAGALVNGMSIVQERNVPTTFTYYHVELDDHSLILAEDTPAETFVDNVDRMGFDNWAEYDALYPEGKSITELPYPRAKSRRQVPVSTRVMLAARALELFPEVAVGEVA